MVEYTTFHGVVLDAIVNEFHSAFLGFGRPHHARWTGLRYTADYRVNRSALARRDTLTLPQSPTSATVIPAIVSNLDVSEWYITTGGAAAPEVASFIEHPANPIDQYRITAVTLGCVTIASPVRSFRATLYVEDKPGSPATLLGAGINVPQEFITATLNGHARSFIGTLDTGIDLTPDGELKAPLPSEAGADLLSVTRSNARSFEVCFGPPPNSGEWVTDHLLVYEKNADGTKGAQVGRHVLPNGEGGCVTVSFNADRATPFLVERLTLYRDYSTYRSGTYEIAGTTGVVVDRPSYGADNKPVFTNVPTNPFFYDEIVASTPDIDFERCVA